MYTRYLKGKLSKFENWDNVSKNHNESRASGQFPEIQFARNIGSTQLFRKVIEIRIPRRSLEIQIFQNIGIANYYDWKKLISSLQLTQHTSNIF